MTKDTEEIHNNIMDKLYNSIYNVKESLTDEEIEYMNGGQLEAGLTPKGEGKRSSSHFFIISKATKQVKESNI